MTTPPPPDPSAQTLAVLVNRLRERHAATGKSGRALAQEVGLSQARFSRIENGKAVPNRDDIARLVRGTRRTDDKGNFTETDEDLDREIEELNAMLSAYQREKQEFRLLYKTSGGAAAYQAQVGALEAGATLVGGFLVAHVPALLQTPDYARALLQKPSSLKAWGSEEEIENVVAERMRRQDLLYAQGTRCVFVIAEAVLYTLLVPPAVQVAQLGKMLLAADLPSVDLRIIPFGTQLPSFPFSFRIHQSGGTTLVISESLVEERQFTSEENPEAIDAFTRAWSDLQDAAVTGEDAATLIRKAMRSLADPN